MTSRNTGTLLSWTAIVFILAAPFSAAAQEEPASSPDRDVVDFDEIVVTAHRREQSIQSVPAAVSILQGSYLTDNSVRTIQDIGASVPGLVVTDSVNYGLAPLSIRGIGGANGGGNLFADEPVAVYVDDAYVARLRTTTADLLDVDRIEVLRGPQGTLFGRNATAGALLVHSAEPTAELFGYARVSVTTLGNYRLQAAVTGPLDSSAVWTGRFAASMSSRDGFGTNAGGLRLNGGNDMRARAFLRFAPSEQLQIDLIAEVSGLRSEPGTIAIADVSNVRDARIRADGDNRVFPFRARDDLPDLVRNSRYALNAPNFNEIDGTGATLRGVWTRERAEITSITNYRRWSVTGAQDSDGTDVIPPVPEFVGGPVPNVGDNVVGSFRDWQFSQELRIASTATGRLSWLVGGYVFFEENRVDPITINNRLAGPGGAGTSAIFRTNQRTQSLAGFADFSYALSDVLTVSTGLRHTNENKSFENSLTINILNSFDPPGPTNFSAGQMLASLPTLIAERNESSFAPRLLAEWQASDQLLVYAGYSRGFKSGGFNAFRGTNPEFAGEVVDGFEIGLKYAPQRRLRAAVSIFHQGYRELQVRVPVPSGGIGIETLPSARSIGAEFETTFVPLAGLTIDAGIALLDARITRGLMSTLSGDSFILGSAPATTLVDVGGNRLSRAPEFQGFVRALYSWHADRLKYQANINLRAQSAVSFLETNQDAITFVGDAWNEVGARFSLGSFDDRWAIAAFVTNLFDTRHFTQVSAFFGLPNGALNNPRSVGLEFSYRY